MCLHCGAEWGRGGEEGVANGMSEGRFWNMGRLHHKWEMETSCRHTGEWAFRGVRTVFADSAPVNRSVVQ